MDKKTGMPRYDVAVIADIFADVVITGNEKPSFGQVETLADSYEIELGGSGPIFASQIVKLGGTVAMLTIVGDDPMGKMVLARIKAIGIDDRFIKQSSNNKTPLGLNISVRDDRSLLTVLGTLNDISADIIDQTLLDHVKHWHIAGYFLLPALMGFWPDFLDRLKEKGITRSLDTNWSPLGNWNQVVEILPRIDLFLPNEEEAMAITGESGYQKAGIELSKLVPLVVIKRGERGASAFIKGREIRASNQENWIGEINVMDTTGAGDSFDGGFIHEWIQGGTVEECLKTGIICGISNVQDIGGIRSQFTV